MRIFHLGHWVLDLIFIADPCHQHQHHHQHNRQHQHHHQHHRQHQHHHGCQVENGVAKGGLAQHHPQVSNCSEQTKEVALLLSIFHFIKLIKKEKTYFKVIFDIFRGCKSVLCHSEFGVWYISEWFQVGQDGGSVGQGSCNSSDIIFQCWKPFKNQHCEI